MVRWLVGIYYVHNYPYRNQKLESEDYDWRRTGWACYDVGFITPKRATQDAGTYATRMHQDTLHTGSHRENLTQLQFAPRVTDPNHRIQFSFPAFFFRKQFNIFMPLNSNLA